MVAAAGRGLAQENPRVGLMRLLQAQGAMRLDVTVSLIGEYREDDSRLRWRVMATGMGETQTFSGRTLEEALAGLLPEVT